ncbi:phage gp6-like head-tail connector protein [Bacillus sp. ISL-8]|uniref:DNA-packaging protein n=1 Tax=Bacillus mycoides TaxID=1405 RepID=A0A1W6A3V3_BACMY|nr:head-tail connector protein [Bacillus mycoides]ARJ20518.1 DNA-packaging protein [Bacillus mycoides]ARJ23804.1 DNA-packaging protein [Bacillus mycoides]MBT2580395.1 phage gp6-like head-tail connector protein [Bacillus sp. ISL-8]TKI79411.1 phage gp6-like head-tail connector protein [Bacillus mycoides]
MKISLDEAKQYVKVDGSEEDNLLTSFIMAAEEYLKDAGVTNTEAERYKIAVMILVAEWYENRGISKISDELSYSLRSLILQLR